LKKIAIGLATALISSATAGVMHKNVAVGIGTEKSNMTIQSSSNLSIELSAGTKYFWTTGIVLGADVGFGYTKVPAGVVSTEEEKLVSFNSNLKLGYSFGGDSGKGLGIYGLYGFRLGGTFYTDSQSKDKISTSTGEGAGAQVEYVFDNGWTIGAIYQTYSMTFDMAGIDSASDNTNISARIGYQW